MHEHLEDTHDQDFTGNISREQTLSQVHELLQISLSTVKGGQNYVKTTISADEQFIIKDTGANVNQSTNPDRLL